MVVCSFVLFLLVIALSVILGFSASGYTFGIVQLFLDKKCLIQNHYFLYYICFIQIAVRHEHLKKFIQ